MILLRLTVSSAKLCMSTDNFLSGCPVPLYIRCTPLYYTKHTLHRVKIVSAYPLTACTVLNLRSGKHHATLTLCHLYNKIVPNVLILNRRDINNLGTENELTYWFTVVIYVEKFFYFRGMNELKTKRIIQLVLILIGCKWIFIGGIFW